MPPPAEFVAELTFRFVRRFVDGQAARVVEVGCGSGLLARRLMCQHHEVVAIDTSPDAVRAAAAIGVPARCIRWEDLVVNDADAVIFVRSLHHLHDLDQAIERAVAALVPGGRIIIDEFAWERFDQPAVQWLQRTFRATQSACQHRADSFVGELLRSADPLGFWRQDHDGLHQALDIVRSVEAVGTVLAEESFPYLFRYIAPSLAADDSGGKVLEQIYRQEQQAIAAGEIPAVGQRIVVAPR